MKIRWTENSVRLRITPSELEALQRNEIVREKLGFDEDEQGWSAAIMPNGMQTSVRLIDGSLLIHLSNADRAQLSDPASEGVYFQQELLQRNLLIRYYIEKDFPCVHPRASEALEPQTETFEAPEDFVTRKL